MKQIRVDVLYSEGCKSLPLTIGLIHALADDLDIDVTIHEIEISTHEQAVEYKYCGSPTVRIGGQDIYKDMRNSKNYGLG